MLSDDISDLPPQMKVRSLRVQTLRLEHSIREVPHVWRRLSDQSVPAVRRQAESKLDAKHAEQLVNLLRFGRP